ncbi:MAG: hypothetical protein DELT_00630 [Desulfovibrio sp.]
MTEYSRLFCVHGHFYQPPREDPWLGRILIESSAAPMRHWNERIVAESYGPMGWAHRMDDGKIIEICNCYEWISFNVGPTLMDWLRRETPGVYERIREADAASRRRLGHGNAMAQVYHHAIMPLASPLDKELEAAWAVMDFEKHFGRKPEGMWLAESAVDAASLEALAKEGISFVILAPRQAKAVSGADGFVPVSDGNFDVTKPYRVDLPSGASMAVFFYHGPLSQAVAFERLLENGETFWHRINQNAPGGLLTLATDGETYGHHFPFGEMALAYVLAQGREGREGLGLSNPAAYLAANPPKDRALLHEPSSWSCAHGVERWRSDCGCTDGGHPDWNQRWRGPLREALAAAKSALDEHFFAKGKACFVDPLRALREYGRVLADKSTADSFAREHILPGGDAANMAWKLLTMQEQALAAFASCAWFFDDISRIEPVNGMTYMWRAMELALATGGPDLREGFSRALAEAESNKPEEGTGADILRKRVMPRQQNAASLSLLALTLMDIDETFSELGSESGPESGPELGSKSGPESVFSWPAFSLSVSVTGVQPGGTHGETRVVTGKAVLGTPLEKGGEAFAFTWHAPSYESAAPSGGLLGSSAITVVLPDGKTLTCDFASLPRHAREYAALRLAERIQRDTAKNAERFAQHLLSIIDEWEEAQNSMPYAWDWTAVAPYLLTACVTAATVDEAKREQVAAFLQKLGICGAARELAWRTLEKTLLAALEKDATDWRQLAMWVNRARKYLPEMNFWTVQNAFAAHGGSGADKALLGSALTFA